MAVLKLILTIIKLGCKVPSLKASRLGIVKIRQARNEKGWGWSINDDDTCFVEASKIVEPEKNWQPGGPYADGVSEGTWKRFLAGRQAISAAAFKAFCQILGLNWQEVVDRRTQLDHNTRTDWGDAIDISVFYGRSAELEQLEQWITKEDCRLVALFGMGGIGKTALALKLAEQVKEHFEYLIWRSLRNAPPLQEFISDMIEFLSNGRETDLSESLDSGVSRLLGHLREHRCLLLLDDFETVMRGGELAGQYRGGYQGYGKLIQRVGEERHQSCLVLTTREKPTEISSLAGTTLPVRELKLRGLGYEDATKILQTKGFSNLKRGSEELIQLYRGNPSALKIVASTIKEVFNGDIYQFIDQSTLVVNDVLNNLLSEQFQRLSALEVEIIYWLALENYPISIPELKANMQFSGVSSSQLIVALTSLQRRSLLDKKSIQEVEEVVFTLQPVVMKYLTNQFIEQVCKEIRTVVKTKSLVKLLLLRSHALLNEQEDDELKAIQIRRILEPVIEKLYVKLKSADLVVQLKEILSMLKDKSPPIVGYAQINILNLLNMTENKLQQP
ncbi:MAG: NB-ARC domain-containing protein [Symploca sp. SIO2B6]|nr:NB-ARC domain-containing protein [Symploca sp. SIO2B6]